MERKLKDITLYDDVISDINNGVFNSSLYLDRYKSYIKKANSVIDTRLDKLEDEDFFNLLNTIFDITFDEEDYLKMLSLKHEKHFIKYFDVRTNMYDEDNNNICFYCVATNKVRGQSNSFFDLKSLRTLINDSDLVILNEYKKKTNYLITKREEYESFVRDSVDVTKKVISVEDEMYPYAIRVLRKGTLIKEVLADTNRYVSEVTYQKNCIMKLADDEKSGVYSSIHNYVTDFLRASNDSILPRVKKAPVTYQKKKKKKKNKRA